MISVSDLATTNKIALSDILQMYREKFLSTRELCIRIGCTEESNRLVFIKKSLKVIEHDVDYRSPHCISSDKNQLNPGDTFFLLAICYVYPAYNLTFMVSYTYTYKTIAL